MLTRTERFEAGVSPDLEEGIGAMEDAGWAVRQIAVINEYVSYVVFECES